MSLGYVGSKRRIIKELLPIFNQYIGERTLYYEPFVGGCNSMIHVKAPFRMGSDVNPWVVDLWSAVANDPDFQVPEMVTEEMYNKAKKLFKAIEQDPAMQADTPELTRIRARLAFIAIASSFGNKMWGGFARDKSRENYNKGREGANLLNKHRDKLTGVMFCYGSYDETLESWDEVDRLLKDSSPFNDLWDNMLIYCDPPYAGTTKYRSGEFDSERFWQWVREGSQLDNVTILVSEYSAPEDFECIWEKDVTVMLKKVDYDQKTERLFKWKG